MRLNYSRKFAAAHRLYDESKSVDWNFKIFGECCNLHGHTWKVEFGLEGPPNFETGMLINFTELKELIDSLDHCYLNAVVKFLPTAENVAKYFLEQLYKKQLFSYIMVTVHESDHAYATEEWRAE